jgi:hypothetical protein
LFQRLVTVGKCNENLTDVFQYELCSYPPSLFENRRIPRLANKASLADELWKHMPTDVAVLSTNLQFVLDGGALLHRIPWNCGSTYDEICQQYTSYVRSHYGKSVIVFDGYLNGPSTKDITHERRTLMYVGATVQVSGSMVFQGKKTEFLSNHKNKQKFIDLLGDHLKTDGCHVEHACGDADLLIVQTVISAAQTHIDKSTVVIADDIDVLILLCWHTKSTTPSIYFRPEPRQDNKKSTRCWNVHEMRTALAPRVTDNILFLHALLGCDTTSSLYGIGKKMGLKLICSNEVFLRQAKVFAEKNSTNEKIRVAGEKALIQVYKGQEGDTLDYLRLQQFQQKVGSSSSLVRPEVLPPTSAAAAYHSMRVYLQVQEWMGNGDNMNPNAWGWYKQSAKYLPVLTDKEAAPAALLQVVRCNCKTGCSTRHCTCRKNGLDCSAGCGNCRGVCSNIAILDDEEMIAE